MTQVSPNESVLDGIGEEVTRVALPVSICMLITVFLVTTLNPAGDSNSNAVYIASIYYQENVSILRQLIRIRLVRLIASRCLYFQVVASIGFLKATLRDGNEFGF